jgi:hypothetical protein
VPDDDNQSDSTISDAEPPPAGDDTEPAPAGETSPEDDDTNKPLEDNEGHSDSSAETDGDSDSSSSSDSSSRRRTKSSSDSSSSDDSSPQPECVALTEDDIQDAITSALQDRDVKVDDDGVKVSTSSSGMFTFMVRLTADSQPLPQVPDDTSNLAPGSVQGAMKLLQGSVQALDGATRVIMKVVSVETSEILETGQGDASAGTKDAVQAAAEDALAGCSSLGAT